MNNNNEKNNIEVNNLIMYILFFALVHLFYTKITLKK
jgi:hypothetical protein